jgi:hypothetical protein
MNYEDLRLNEHISSMNSIDRLVLHKQGDYHNDVMSNVNQQPYVPNYNNIWQRPHMANSDNRPNNRYPPGSQGWYATGGNHQYNNGQSVHFDVCLHWLGVLYLSSLFLLQT